MKWKESPIIDITSTKVIYYDPKHSDICTRICKVLYIDIMPALVRDFYWFLSNSEGWQKLEIKEDQKLNGNLTTFDERCLDQFLKADSNILFVYLNDFFKGIIHFTDYTRKQVYMDLYHNLHVYETSLKNYLIAEKFSYQDFLAFYKYRMNRDLNHKFYRDRYNHLKETISMKRHREFAPLDKLYLSDMMEFAISDFHIEMNRPIPLNKFDVQGVGIVRNIVMHSEIFIGKSDFLPHDRDSFEAFFKKILNFKKAFLDLHAKIEKRRLEKLPEINRNWLKSVEGMNDYSLNEFFYDTNS